MMMFVKIGFRNIFRNKRRSMLTSIVIAIGLAAMIITDGFLVGMTEYMINTITTSLVTEGQIHHPTFKTSYKVEDTINNIADVESTLENDQQVKFYGKRVLSFAMISSPKNMKNITLIGIDPLEEIKISTINKNIIAGEFVSNEKSLVIGALLMQRLELVIGDKVVVTAAEAHTGEIAQEMMRISGVLKMGSKYMDEKVAFVHIDRAQKILKIDNGIHQIGIVFNDRLKAQNSNYHLWQKLNKTNNSSQSWLQISSSFIGMLKMLDKSKAIMVLILMILVGLAIINTLFMALYERLFEFAVLRALGTKGSEIIVMILAEAASLALLSIILGLLLTLIFAVPMAYYGINYGGIEFADVTFREPLYYAFRWYQYLYFPLVTLFFTMIISLYPAFYAARMTMSQTLKKSL